MKSSPTLVLDDEEKEEKEESEDLGSTDSSSSSSSDEDEDEDDEDNGNDQAGRKEVVDVWRSQVKMEISRKKRMLRRSMMNWRMIPMRHQSRGQCVRSFLLSFFYYGPRNFHHNLYLCMYSELQQNIIGFKDLCEEHGSNGDIMFGLATMVRHWNTMPYTFSAPRWVTDLPYYYIDERSRSSST